MFSPRQPSRQIIRTPAYPWLLDDAGFVRAGHVLKLIDISGSEAALQHLNRNGQRNLVVTASLDRTNFKQPIRLWEMISLESRITQVWNTSMEVQV
ncbi:MAG TPA: acyl-CoA thioesterase, partial [Oculatellaceae cyanobacterium]